MNRFRIVQRVLRRHLRNKVASHHMSRIAGEVRHVKDNTGDASQWAYSLHAPNERAITKDFHYDPKEAKTLAKCLRATNAALGHASSAQTQFTKLKSRKVSPDGRLGGKGYISNIKDMRRQFFNIVEALSALSDTLYDEVSAPHWSASSRGAEDDVDKIVEHAEKIKQNPDAWSEEELDQDQEERT